MDVGPAFYFLIENLKNFSISVTYLIQMPNFKIQLSQDLTKIFKKNYWPFWVVLITNKNHLPPVQNSPIELVSMRKK